jgi:PleD family two-component response regulator
LRLCRIIKSNEKSNYIPVVVPVALASPNKPDECRRLGVTIFINKPLEYENFIIAIKDIDEIAHNPGGNAF